MQPNSIFHHTNAVASWTEFVSHIILKSIIKREQTVPVLISSLHGLKKDHLITSYM